MSDYVSDLVEIFSRGVPDGKPFGTEVVGLLMAASCQRDQPSLEERGLSRFECGESRPWTWVDENAMPVGRRPWNSIDHSPEKWYMYSDNFGVWEIRRVAENQGQIEFFGRDHNGVERTLSSMARANMKLWYNPKHQVSRMLDMSTLEQSDFGPYVKNWAVMRPANEQVGWGPGKMTSWCAMASHYARIFNRLGRQPQTMGI